MKNNGNKKENRRKKMNAVLLLLLMTAIMVIISTYAWFSSQKNVTIRNLRGRVAVAEGLEISLNAKDWSQEVDLDSVDWSTDSYENNKNNIPSEFQPVSTDCGGLGTAEDLTFYKGTLHNTVNLKDLIECELNSEDNEIEVSDPKYPGYYAFDIFLKNTTNGNVTTDALQLNYDSYVKVLQSGDGLNPLDEDYETKLQQLIAQREATGLQNTVRVAFALFKGTSGTMDTQDTILANTVGATSPIDSVSIWEPNAAAHIESVINSYNGEKPISPITTANGKLSFTADEIIPTFAIKTLPSHSSTSLSNIYNWVVGNEDLAQQMALQTDAVTGTYTIGTGVSQLITSTIANNSKWNQKAATSSVSTSGAGADDANKKGADTNFTIPANSICRMRVFVWLEGQDVDCLSIASHGGGVEVNLDIMKDGELGALGE